MSSAVRVGQRRKSGLGQGHGKIGGHRRPKLEGETGDWLLARLAEKPELTMRALTAELADRGVHVVHDTVWRFVLQEGLIPTALTANLSRLSRDAEAGN